MSERDLKRIEVLTDVLGSRRTVIAATSVLGLSGRQAYWLLSRYQAYDCKQLILNAMYPPKNSVASTSTYTTSGDGRLEVHSKGRLLPYRVSTKASV